VALTTSRPPVSRCGEAAARESYLIVKKQWVTILPEQEAFFSKFRDRRSRIGVPPCGPSMATPAAPRPC